MFENSLKLNGKYIQYGWKYVLLVRKSDFDDKKKLDMTASRFCSPLGGVKKDPLEETITRASVGDHDEVLQCLNKV